MKKINLQTAVVLLFAAVLCLAVFTSCNKEIESVNTSPYEAEQKKNIHFAGAIGHSTHASDTTKRWNIDHHVFGRLVANADEKRLYAEYYAPTAIEEMRKFGIPASIKLAQAILESDGGTSYKAARFNNHFGIKKKATKYLEVSYLVDPNDVNGDLDEFCVYESPWFSYRSHSLFLAERERYKPCFDCEYNYKCWARELQKSGYSTNEDYHEILIAVIEYYGLQKYDNQVSRVNKLPEGKLVVGTWLLNNSHGENTPGKRKIFSKNLPNGEKTIFEYKLNRQIVSKLVKRCNDLGLTYKLIVPELQDVSLRERVARANQFEKQLGNTALITIDHNATPFDNTNSESIASRYDFLSEQVASGMESHNFKGSQMEQFNKRLAENVEHFLPNWHSRGVKQSRFYTLRKSNMPATILELGFFDNYQEACFILSDDFQGRIVEAIVMTMCEFSEVEYVGNGIQG